MPARVPGGAVAAVAAVGFIATLIGGSWVTATTLQSELCATVRQSLTSNGVAASVQCQGRDVVVDAPAGSLTDAAAIIAAVPGVGTVSSGALPGVTAADSERSATPTASVAPTAVSSGPESTTSSTAVASHSATPTSSAPPSPTPTPTSTIPAPDWPLVVHFAGGSARLSASDRTAVQGLVPYLEQQDGISVSLVGYTDSGRTQAFREALGLERAEAVRDALVAAGIDASRISVSSRADADPVASNATAQGRAANRRVEINGIGEA